MNCRGNILNLFYMQELAHMFTLIKLNIYCTYSSYGCLFLKRQGFFSRFFYSITNQFTHLLHCKWQRASQAFLCPDSISAAPVWKDRTGRPFPFFLLSPCLFLCLALSHVRRSVAAGGAPQTGGPWRSQPQPDNREQTERVRGLQIQRKSSVN